MHHVATSAIITGKCAGGLLGWRVIGYGGDELTHHPLLRVTDGGGDRNIMSSGGGVSRVGGVTGRLVVGHGKIRCGAGLFCGWGGVLVICGDAQCWGK